MESDTDEELTLMDRPVKRNAISTLETGEFRK